MGQAGLPDALHSFCGRCEQHEGMGVMHAADDWNGCNSSTAEEMRLDTEMWTELPAAVAGW